MFVVENSRGRLIVEEKFPTLSLLNIAEGNSSAAFSNDLCFCISLLGLLLAEFLDFYNKLDLAFLRLFISFSYSCISLIIGTRWDESVS